MRRNVLYVLEKTACTFSYPDLPTTFSSAALRQSLFFDLFLKEHVKVVRSGDIPVYLETMEPGAMYCVKAQALVKAIGRRSAFSQTECVEMQGKDNFPVPGSPHLAALPVHTWMPMRCLWFQVFPWLYVFASWFCGFWGKLQFPWVGAHPGGWVGFLEYCVEHFPPKPPPSGAHATKLACQRMLPVGKDGCRRARPRKEAHGITKLQLLLSGRDLIDYRIPFLD